MADGDAVLLDAGLFIGALMQGDPRHVEAREIVEQARRGQRIAYTTTSILCEVYAALTWEGAQPPQSPQVAAEAVRLLVDAPSSIRILHENEAVLARALAIAERHGLRARRIHDARHAAAAIIAGVKHVLTYDMDDWRHFEPEGVKALHPDGAL